MAELDAITAQIRTLKGYLENLPANLRPITQAPGALAYVQEGWPGGEQDLAYPTIAIHAPTGGNLELLAPRLLSQAVVAPGTADVPGVVDTYSVGTMTSDVVLDVFASSRLERARVLRSLEIALSGGGIAVGSSALRLTSADYYGAQIGYRRAGAITYDDSSIRVSGDEWRATVPLQAECEAIIQVEEVRLLTLDLATIICLTFNIPTTISPSETRRIFQPPA